MAVAKKKVPASPATKPTASKKVRAKPGIEKVPAKPATEETAEVTSIGAAKKKRPGVKKPSGAAPKSSTRAATRSKKKAAAESIIQKVEAEMGSLTKETALARLSELTDHVKFAWFQIGGVLSQIQEQDWWMEEGYETLKEYIENEYDIKYRTAMHWISIYNNLTHSEIPWDVVKDVGWTKLAEIAHLLTPDNVEEWVQIAQDNTVLKLRDKVLAAKKKAEKGEGEEYEKEGEYDDKDVIDDGEEVTSTVTLTFRMKEDTKETVNSGIEQVMEDQELDSSGAALAFLTTAYMEGSLGETDLIATLQEYDPEDIIEAIEQAFEGAECVIEFEEEG